MHALALLVALAALALLPAAPARAGGPWRPAEHRATADARAETPDGVVPAVVKVLCRGGDGGTVCVGVKVEDAERVASFDFDAFEGPDAKAAALPLFTGHVGATTVEGPVVGRAVADPPGAFLFEFCGPSRGPSGAKTLAHAIAGGAGAGEVELAIAHPSRDGRAIRARVPADAPGGDVAKALKGCPADR